MSDHHDVTCEDCFFRQADLCALPGNEPCPTFRACTGDSLNATPDAGAHATEALAEPQPVLAASAA